MLNMRAPRDAADVQSVTKFSPYTMQHVHSNGFHCLSYANLQFIDVSGHCRDLNQALDIPPQKETVFLKLFLHAATKAVTSIVGAIVETTRRMRAAGDLNYIFTVALSFPTERDVLALAATKK
jgi:hypothetical protein